MQRNKINLTTLFGYETLVYQEGTTLPVIVNTPKEELAGRATLYNIEEQVFADIKLDGVKDFLQMLPGGQRVSDTEFHLSFLHITK